MPKGVGYPATGPGSRKQRQKRTQSALKTIASLSQRGKAAGANMQSFSTEGLQVIKNTAMSPITRTRAQRVLESRAANQTYTTVGRKPRFR